MEHKEKDFSLSWFFKWFVDNKAITVFLVTLLMGLNILVLSKISFIFTPLLEFGAAVMLPVIISGLLYYLLNPIVDFLERHRVKRIIAISIVFILIALLILWGLAVAIPAIQHQVLSFMKNLPDYLEKANRTIDDVLDNKVSPEIKPQLDEWTSQLSQNITSWASSFSARAVNWVSNLITVASQVIIALIIMPFIVFYLLRDGKNLKGQIIRFLPTKIRKSADKVLSDVNTQLANYV